MVSLPLKKQQLVLVVLHVSVLLADSVLCPDDVYPRRGRVCIPAKSDNRIQHGRYDIGTGVAYYYGSRCMKVPSSVVRSRSAALGRAACDDALRSAAGGGY